MKKKFLTALIALPILFFACTDLDETYYNEIDGKLIPSSSKIEAVYGTLKGYANENPYACPWWKFVYTIQTSTDEICVPIQNSMDWYDGGVYIDMQQHTWKPDNIHFLSCWNYLYNIITNCNMLLAQGDLGYDGLAELQTLRAYAYYRLMDLFGNVPLLTEKNFNDSKMPKNTSRAELFQWIEQQLTTIEGSDEKVEDHLCLKKYGKMTKGVLNTLRIRLYLNSKVFLDLADDSPEYKEYLNKAIEACDVVINSGAYTLEDNVFANWYYDNGQKSKEIILGIGYIGDGTNEGNDLQMESFAGPAGGMDRVFGNEMYGHCPGGFMVTPGKTADDPNALFNIFAPNDNRRLSMLYGQTYDRNTKEPVAWSIWLKSDPDNPNPNYVDGGGTTTGKPPKYLNYAPFFTRGLTYSAYMNPAIAAPRTVGARLIKFEVVDNPQFYQSQVDAVVMRYAEVLYSKAECLIRLGRAGESVSLFQEVLKHRGFDPTDGSGYDETAKGYPFRDMDKDNAGNDTNEKISAVALMSKRWLKPTDLSSIIPPNPDLEFMDKEWRREFIFEDRRRADMIRMGKYITTTWGGHTTPTNDKNRNLFPIPQSILDAQPEVEQNPGY
ncbi:MAG: RagB/SusD family nutrient uptake outer membrane protein [Prevotellaceae bacterium]|jgi:hypothetical protein|nr:RagB/SusD family nutrient uptake outer membrane protein [Prevotellaceae bacterium]